MPEIDGFEAAERIKKMRNDLPVIAQTAYGSAYSDDIFDNMNMDGFLIKPYLKDQMISMISSVIN